MAFTGGTPYEAIVTIMQQRMNQASRPLQLMQDVRRRYNGPAIDYILPWWDVQRDEDDQQSQQYTPMLVAEIVDNDARRAADVEPFEWSPALQKGKQKGVRSREYARIRTDALAATKQHSRFPLGMRRLFRQLSAYGTCCALALPDDRKMMPRVEIRDPLTAFPDERAAEDYRQHENVGFVIGRSASWLRDRYPESRMENGGPVPAPERHSDSLWDMIEWFDEQAVVMGILGPRDSARTTSQKLGGTQFKELRRWENKAGVVPIMIPCQVTLDTILSQIMNILPHVDLMAKLQLMEVIQSERAIMPDTYVASADSRPVMINNNGDWWEGRDGKGPNRLSNVSAIGTLHIPPDPNSRGTIDRVERNVRVSTGLMPQFGGETYGALRTGRGIDALTGVALDPRLKEMHEIMEQFLPDLNAAILATYKGYYGARTYSLYSGSETSLAKFDFTPNDHIEDELTTMVKYAIPGADAVETNIILSQMSAAGAISMRSFRRRHPWIGDPDDEQALIDEEDAENAIKTMVFNDAANGLAPKMLVALFEKYRRDPEVADAVEALERANEELQDIQASQAPPPGEGQVLPPEAMPGIDAGPGGAAQQLPGGPPIAEGASPGMAGLREVTNALAASSRDVSGVA